MWNSTVQNDEYISIIVIVCIIISNIAAVGYMSPPINLAGEICSHAHIYQSIFMFVVAEV